jgi:hypothetical protein
MTESSALTGVARSNAEMELADTVANHMYDKGIRIIDLITYSKTLVDNGDAASIFVSLYGGTSPTDLPNMERCRIILDALDVLRAIELITNEKVTDDG